MLFPLVHQGISKQNFEKDKADYKEDLIECIEEYTL